MIQPYLIQSSRQVNLSLCCLIRLSTKMVCKSILSLLQSFLALHKLLQFSKVWLYGYLLEINKINEEWRFPFDRKLDNVFQGKYLVDAAFSFSTGWHASDALSILLRSTLQKILLGMDSRVIPRQISKVSFLGMLYNKTI